MFFSENEFILRDKKDTKGVRQTNVMLVGTMILTNATGSLLGVEITERNGFVLTLRFLIPPTKQSGSLTLPKERFYAYVACLENGTIKILVNFS